VIVIGGRKAPDQLNTGHRTLDTHYGKTNSRGGAAAAPEKKARRTFKKKERKHVPHGLVYVQASFNNTIVTITDMNGNTLSWKSSGSLGFRGRVKAHPSRRSRRRRTPPIWPRSWRSQRGCARQRPGSGRESAVRALSASGIEVRSIRDVTPIPHNGCRPPKRRRV